MVQILPDHHLASPLPCTFTKPKSKPILLLIITITFGLLLFVVCYSKIEFSSSRWDVTSLFSVIIDAGSSGTRVHLFRYWIESGKPVFDFGEENYPSLKLAPGLSA